MRLRRAPRSRSMLASLLESDSALTTLPPTDFHVAPAPRWVAHSLLEGLILATGTLHGGNPRSFC